MIVTQEQAHRLGCPLRVTCHVTIMDELAVACAPCLHEQRMAWRWADAAMDCEKLPDSFRADDHPRDYGGLAGTQLNLR